MKYKKVKIDRLLYMFKLIEDFIPIRWIVEKPKGFYKFLTLNEYLVNIAFDIECILKGYYVFLFFEDEHFLTYDEVFGDRECG